MPAVISLKVRYLTANPDRIKLVLQGACNGAVEVANTQNGVGYFRHFLGVDFDEFNGVC